MYNDSRYRIKKDRDREEIEFEKQKSELTFEPKILKRNANGYTQREVPDIEEVVQRMNKARRVFKYRHIGKRMLTIS